MTKTTPFTYASLFSGIGGFEQALNKLGGTCVLASEIDKFANQAYEVLYGHKTVGDITKIQAEDVPNHDVLVGGFPCQSFSVAGKRGGFDDARGTLFFEMARIADEKKPKIILAENVKGLVGHDRGRTLDTIVKTLNDIGYRVDFNVLNSKYFGVPQNRERIFLVGVREDLIENEPWTDVKGTTVVPKGKRRINEYEDVKTFNFDWPEQVEVTTKLRDILETHVDEKYYLSEEKTGKLISQLNKTFRREVIKSGICPTLSTRPDGFKTAPLPVTREYRIRKLTPLECWRLQGFPDEAHEAVKQAGISDTQRYKMAGNAVTVNVIEALGQRLISYLQAEK